MSEHIKWKFEGNLYVGIKLCMKIAFKSSTNLQNWCAALYCPHVSLLSHQLIIACAGLNLGPRIQMAIFQLFWNDDYCFSFKISNCHL